MRCLICCIVIAVARLRRGSELSYFSMTRFGQVDGDCQAWRLEEEFIPLLFKSLAYSLA